MQENQTGFSGGSKYVLDEELAKIVNISMALEMPLLLKGEPGTGKTMLAHAISEAFGMKLIVLNVKSSMKLIDALYQYDTLTRLNDSRFGDSKRDVSNIEDYIRMGKIGQAFVSDERVVLLIDEIDKADTDFQDDMLDVLDQMEFDIIEIDKTIRAKAQARHHHHLQCEERPLRPFPGPLQFPSYRLSRGRHDEKDRYQFTFRILTRSCSTARSGPFIASGRSKGLKRSPPPRELINWLRALRAIPTSKSRALIKGEVPYLGFCSRRVLIISGPECDFPASGFRGDLR